MIYERKTEVRKFSHETMFVASDAGHFARNSGDTTSEANNNGLLTMELDNYSRINLEN